MENQKNHDEIEIDLMEVFGLLLSKIWLILGMGVTFAAAGFIISQFLITPVFESTTKIYILNKTENASITYSDVQMGTQLTKDYAELIGGRYVLEEVIAALSLDMEYEDLYKTVSVATPSDTRIVSITVESTVPEEARDIANCIREVASAHIQNVMDIDAVNVVEEANLPVEKARPSSLKWTLAGGVLGCFLICVIILVQYLMDDTIKSSEDVEKYLGLSTLALIPVEEEEGASSKKKYKGKNSKSKTDKKTDK